jgi:uncharacterized membrane protein
MKLLPQLTPSQWLLLAAAVAIGVAVGYYFGYDIGWEKALLSKP